MALVKSVSASSPSRYLPSQAAASIVVGTVTVILLKWFVWKLLLEVDAVTVASGGSSLSSPPRTPLVGTQLGGMEARFFGEFEAVEGARS
jgi:hypothetical protein